MRISEKTGGLVKSCVVTADAKQKDPDLYKKIAAGYYQHLVIGPEQAAHPDFRAILLDPTFRD